MTSWFTKKLLGEVNRQKRKRNNNYVLRFTHYVIMSKGKLLLINPWIYDFAAFNLWIEPIGLFYIASILLQHGYEITFIDCLDRYHPELLKLQGRDAPELRSYGCGKYYKEIIEKPEILKHFPRNYGRYGITFDIFDAELEKQDKPDVVLVTSKMTYWYPGPFEVIRRVKNRYPDVPLILGGTYATLCYQHAVEHSGADYVIAGEGEFQTLKLVDALAGNVSDQTFSFPKRKSLIKKKSKGIYSYYSSFPMDISDYPFPAHDLNRQRDYVAILTSRGCPMKCTYCATNLLNPAGFRQRRVENVLDELEWCYHELGVRNFAFYDDALLLNAKNHIHKILDGIIQRNFRCYFHTPNSMHAQMIDYDLAPKMYHAGFKTIRISLETSNSERQKSASSNKVTNAGFRRAIENLKAAGFTANDIKAYVMIGLPGQPLQEVRDSIAFIHDCGVQVSLAEYTPIPGTVEWQRAASEYDFNPDSDPLLHNNTIFLFQTDSVIYKDFEKVRMFALEGNRKIVKRDA
ncbi:B12-binding domain-containing radical SAM protein [Candidatus Poribacteria bacterium]|nr:B12-binding domain-containing radical SAM protein [Candidatus Poribacteria bacterium]